MDGKHDNNATGSVANNVPVGFSIGARVLLKRSSGVKGIVLNSSAANNFYECEWKLFSGNTCSSWELGENLELDTEFYQLAARSGTPSQAAQGVTIRRIPGGIVASGLAGGGGGSGTTLPPGAIVSVPSAVSGGGGWMRVPDFQQMSFDLTYGDAELEAHPTAQLQEKRKQEGSCPQCGELGHVDPRTFHFVCSVHGPY